MFADAFFVYFARGCFKESEQLRKSVFLCCNFRPSVRRKIKLLNYYKAIHCNQDNQERRHHKKISLQPPDSGKNKLKPEGSRR